MISLILPYWDRQEASDKALGMLAKAYPDLGMEIVLVDDGNHIPFRKPDLPLDLKIVRRPLKDQPSSCISAWNEGVRQASHDVIVLSCVEVLHYDPVLPQMIAELEKTGPDGYVLAAAWCPELREWHCHSLGGSPAAFPIPEGTGRSFCGMMSKDLFNRAGGFDEDYSEGAGYEDVDFIYRMKRAGAKFVIRDDLIVIHPKAGASIRWPSFMFERNRKLLEKKWGL